MYKIKNTKNILVLLLLSLVTNVSFAMKKRKGRRKKKHKKELILIRKTLFDNYVESFSYAKISSQAARKLSTYYLGNTPSQEEVELLTVINWTDKRISIWDIKQEKEIYNFNEHNIIKKIDKLQDKEIFTQQANISEKNGNPFLRIQYYSYQNDMTENHSICEYDIPNDTISLISSYNNRDFLAFYGRKQIKHQGYTLKLRSSFGQLIITHKKFEKPVSISINHSIIVAFTSPNPNSKKVITFSVVKLPCVYRASLYNIDTGECIKRKCFDVKWKPLNFYFSQPIFSKNENFIAMKFSKNLYVYDLKNSKIALHKKFPEGRTRKPLSPALTDDEKTIIVYDKGYFYFYRNPLAPNEYKNDLIERKKYLEEKHSEFKIKFIDDQTINAAKLLLFGK